MNSLVNSLRYAVDMILLSVRDEGEKFLSWVQRAKTDFITRQSLKGRELFLGEAAPHLDRPTIAKQIIGHTTQHCT